MIRDFAFVRIGDPAVADDCTNETFLRVLTTDGRFRCRGAGVRPWLFTIVRNVVRDHGRKAYHRVETLTGLSYDTCDNTADPAYILLAAETRQELDRHLDQLSASQAACLRLRFYQDRSIQQTANLMCLTDNAVKVLQYRAVRKLAQIYADADEHAPGHPSRGPKRLLAALG